MLPLTALSEMKVMVATPCYGGAVSSIYLSSIFNIVNACKDVGLPLKLETISESLVTRERTTLLMKFLADTSYTHLFWWDADVEATPEAVARLLLADREVVAGVYPLKRYDWDPNVVCPATEAEFSARCLTYPFNTIGGKLVSDQYGFGEVQDATTGFMCIKRGVFEKMMEEYPGMKSISGKWLFFDSDLSLDLSEDYAFCKRWRDIGGQVWIDLYSKLNHLGANVWKGDLMSHLRAIKKLTVVEAAA